MNNKFNIGQEVRVIDPKKNSRPHPYRSILENLSERFGDAILKVEKVNRLSNPHGFNYDLSRVNTPPDPLDHVHPDRPNNTVRLHEVFLEFSKGKDIFFEEW